MRAETNNAIVKHAIPKIIFFSNYSMITVTISSNTWYYIYFKIKYYIIVILKIPTNTPKHHQKKSSNSDVFCTTPCITVFFYKQLRWNKYFRYLLNNYL